MPYTINTTNNPFQIQERECASGQEIRFTQFTSCIGVIAKHTGRLTAVHLSLMDQSGNWFGENGDDVNNVINLVLPLSLQKADAVTVFGSIEWWRDAEHPKVRAAFEKLTGTLRDRVGQDIVLYHQGRKKDGTYGAKIAGSGIIIIKC